MGLKRAWRLILCVVLLIIPASFANAAPAPQAHRHFRTAIYITVTDVKRLADPATFNREFARVSSQLKFDKVWIEAYRDRLFATDAELETVKREFQSKGVQTSGGITLAAGGSGGQFGTFDYENPSDVAECQRAVRLIARHFDQVILDDFFFYTSKSDADIAAKGSRSWTQYRLDTMRRMSRECVLGPAKAVNPRVQVIIKYPNWYEHFHGLGFDLDQEAKMFDAIYTGTETRDPIITDQLLQQYESYEIYRYFSNIRPGANLGGWVDTFSIRSIDRYAEQLWDTLFAKAPEITLFNWHPMAEAAPAEAGTRPWAEMHTSFNWNAIAASHPNAGWATAANASLAIADNALGQLGNPVGIASYRAPHATGEDFLHDYLGNLGIPIELYPEYPATAHTILLTEGAATDPDIIAKIDRSLHAGANVIVTSGFLQAMQGRGFEQLAEWHTTGHTIAIDQYFNGFGAGSGKPLTVPGQAAKPILFPEVHFYTNDSWPIIRGVAAAKGFPMVLMNHYSKGTLFLWTMPDNFGDLYNLPQPMLTQVKDYLFADAPVRIDAPPQVALFTYDNGAFVVENFRDEPVHVGISLAGASAGAARKTFAVDLAPHSFRVFGPGR